MTGVPWIVPHALRTLFSRIPGVKGIHTRYLEAYFSKAFDQHFRFCWTEGRQQPPFSFKRNWNDAVMHFNAGCRQANGAATTVVRIVDHINETPLVERSQGAANGRLVQPYRRGNLVGAHIGHRCQYCHDTPIRNAKSEVSVEELRRAAREPAAYVGEKIGNVPIKIEHVAVFFPRGSFVRRFRHGMSVSRPLLKNWREPACQEIAR